jgi:polygalacturonase
VQRRNFVKLFSATSFFSLPNLNHAQTRDPWSRSEEIIKAFKTPIFFKNIDYPITDFGARECQVKKSEIWVAFEKKVEQEIPQSDGFDSNAAINSAISKCHANGGGRVVIPSGNWLSNGPIVLLSNVNLHLEKNTKLYFGNNPKDYAKNGNFDCGSNGRLTLSRWEGNDLLNFSPLIYAYAQENIALTGEDWSSILDGQGGVEFPDDTDCWWSWKGRSKSAFSDTTDHVTNQGRSEAHVNLNNPESLSTVIKNITPENESFLKGEGNRFRRDPEFLRTLAEAGVPATSRIFGNGHYLRPHLIQFINCNRVLLKNYQTRNSPFWQHNPVHCKNLHVDSIFANGTGPNNDGLNPESCVNVLIENCQFNTGDDCIAIEAGKGRDVQYGPSKNIVIQQCKMQSGHGGITIGSIMSGGVENIYVQDIDIQNNHWDTDPINIAIRIKANMNRGGYVRNVYIKNIKIPNGIRTVPSFYKGLNNNSLTQRNIATNAGAVVTIDCGYDPAADNVRTRPPAISNIEISNMDVGNVQVKDKLVSCYQPLVVLGPIPSDFNGKDTMVPKIHPVHNVLIRDCNFGIPVNSTEPIFTYNAIHVRLDNVKIGEKTFNQTFNSLP